MLVCFLVRGIRGRDGGNTPRRLIAMGKKVGNVAVIGDRIGSVRTKKIMMLNRLPKANNPQK